MSVAYSEYLNTLHWQQVRRVVLARAEMRCQLCGAADDDLVCHHRSYLRLGTAAEVRDVIALCKCCHENFHQSGKVQEPDWTDRKYRQVLYRALEIDTATRRIDAAYADKEWT